MDQSTADSLSRYLEIYARKMGDEDVTTFYLTVPPGADVDEYRSRMAEALRRTWKGKVVEVLK